MPGLGFGLRSPDRRLRTEMFRPPRFLRGPLYARPALRPRRDELRLAITAHLARPSHSNKTPAPTGCCISGLHHTAYGLAVYASQYGSPLYHARLASGWRLTSTGWGSIPTGSLREVSLIYMRSPSPRLCLAHIQIQLVGHGEIQAPAFHEIGKSQVNWFRFSPAHGANSPSARNGTSQDRPRRLYRQETAKSSEIDAIARMPAT